jgi:hypothetical protein
VYEALSDLEERDQVLVYEALSCAQVLVYEALSDLEEAVSWIMRMTMIFFSPSPKRDHPIFSFLILFY